MTFDTEPIQRDFGDARRKEIIIPSRRASGRSHGNTVKWNGADPIAFLRVFPAAPYLQYFTVFSSWLPDRMSPWRSLVV